MSESPTFRLVPAALGTFRLQVVDAPSNCLILPQAPSACEPELQTGTWIILLFAVWSGPDRQAVSEALRCAKDMPHMQWAIRPFDDFTEMATWAPSLATEVRSPLWVLWRDGECREVVQGFHPPEFPTIISVRP